MATFTNQTKNSSSYSNRSKNTSSFSNQTRHTQDNRLLIDSAHFLMIDSLNFLLIGGAGGHHYQNLTKH